MSDSLRCLCAAAGRVHAEYHSLNLLVITYLADGICKLGAHDIGIRTVIHNLAVSINDCNLVLAAALLQLCGVLVYLDESHLLDSSCTVLLTKVFLNLILVPDLVNQTFLLILLGVAHLQILYPSVELLLSETA